MLQFYIHDDDAPLFLSEPQTDGERAAFERIRDIEQAQGHIATPMDVKRFNQLAFTDAWTSGSVVRWLPSFRSLTSSRWPRPAPVMCPLRRTTA
jgi:hypothetical protein